MGRSNTRRSASSSPTTSVTPPMGTLPRPPSNTLAVRSPLSTVLTTPRSSWSQSRSSTATPSPRSPVPPSTTRSPPPSASPSPPSICHMPLMLLHTSTESNFTIYHHLRQFSSKTCHHKIKVFPVFYSFSAKKELDNSDRKLKLGLGQKNYTSDVKFRRKRRNIKSVQDCLW